MGAPQELIAGRYRLQRRIAAGGMGVVWEARDELLRRVVAVKQLRTTAGVSEEEAELAKQRAMREARITARLHHQHAVPVFDSVEHEGEPCLVMQYVPSEPLSAVIKRRGALPVAEVARIGAEVAGALAAAHELGIVHRDVKPGNILIADADGAAMLSDFGISHALGDASLTSTGFVHGTPAYLAPEVARGEESTFASDVFSLGSTLYAASEGRPPFGEAPNSIAVLHRVAVGGFQAPTDSGPLGPLLLQMMVSEPDDRPPMREIARRLAALQAELGEELVPTIPLLSDEAAMQDDPDQPTAWVPVERDATSTLVAEAIEATPKPLVPVVADEPTPAPAAAHSVAPPPPPPLEPVEPVEDAPVPARRDRRRAALIGVIVAVVLLTLVALGLALLLRPATQPTGSASGSTRPSSSAPASAASSSATPSASTPSRTPTPSATAPSSAPPTASSAPSASATPSASTGTGAGTTTTPVAAIERYYSLVPGNTDAAWPLMTAAYQSNHAGGRAAYDSFWAQVRSLRVSNVRQIGTNRVEATLTYTRSSGTEVDDTVFTLVREGGVLKIADSSVR